MIRLSNDAIIALDPRRELGRIRAALEERLARDAPVEPVLRALAEKDRVALAELMVGPRARRDPAMVGAALVVVDQLERAIAPNALYRRLAELAGEEAVGVLQVAVDRHPDADWLVALSARVEGTWTGLTHLRVAAERATFLDVCRSYARRGARPALVQVGAERACPEPLRALVEADDRAGVVAAVAALLHHQPAVPVVPLLAALWGPSLDPLLSDVVEAIEGAEGLRALARQARDYPATSARVAARLAHR
jgi:hypothetical protein